MKINLTKQQVAKTIPSMLIILVGALVMAFGNMGFLNNPEVTKTTPIVPGGFTGIAIILDRAWLAKALGVSIPGMIALVFNIPLFVFAIRIKGASFSFLSIWGTVAYSVFIDVIPRLGIDMSGIMRGVTDPTLLATIYGGVCMGIGYGIIIRAGGSTGGTDTLANVLQALKPNWSYGNFLFMADGFVVVLSAVAFLAIAPALYALIVIFISSRIADFVVEGQRNSRAYTIVCADPGKMAQEIFLRVGRGVTAYRAKGMYTNKEKEVLVCVVLRNQSALLKRAVFSVDPKAFLYAANAYEVIGEGFNPHDNPVQQRKAKKKAAEFSAAFGEIKANDTENTNELKIES